MIAAILVGLVAMLLSGRGASVRPAAPIRGVRGHPADAQTTALNRLLARSPIIYGGGSQRREIALTFDDGPGPATPRLLDTLNALRAPGTFFEVGAMIHTFHETLAREVKAGVVIGDHTELHPLMAALTPAAQRDQIVVQTQQLHRYGAAFPRLYRPPYGSFNAATLRILHQLRMLMVLWTVDTKDYRQPGVAAIKRSALTGAKPGAIILLHDGGGTRTQTIAALPGIVHALRARGYTLVTIPQLLLDDPPPRQPARPPRLTGG